MSLLLEALKKAEKAKEEAQRRANAGAEGERAELALQDEAAAQAAERRPVVTRDKLPEISTSMEIAGDDLKPALELAPEPASAAPAPRRREAEPPPAMESQAAERATARKVFEAKATFREPNPRMPFYITMGCLGAFAAGVVVYFYLQLRPPPPLVNANPPRPSAEQATPAVTDLKPAVSVPVPAAQGIPGLPTAASSPAPVAAAAPAAAATPAAPKPAAPPRSSAAAVTTPETPRLRPQPARVRPSPAAETAEPAEAAAGAPRVNPAARATPQVNPRVDAGYAAFQTGDTAAARKEYEQALADDPGNRDALLGLAALDVRAGRYEAAEATYLKLLQANPRDPAANAALVALRAGRQDPLTAESRLKTLIAAEPGAYALNFALGNQFAAQGRWAEAQQEYFKAAAGEPDNADYAYNLAVSLDHLRQSRLARDYYQRAVSLAEKRGASFDLAAARVRLGQLAR